MKTAKRLLAIFLSLLLALPFSMLGMVTAEEASTEFIEPNHKVLASVLSRGSANRHASGFQASNNGMGINVTAMDSTITYDDLALFVNVYIENRDNPDDFTLFEDSMGQFQFVSSIEGNTYYQTCWNWNKQNKFNLKPGWNTLQLNFSTTAKEEGIAADVCNIDLKNINNFRLGFWGFDGDFAEYDNYRIRVANAVLMDTRYEPEQAPTYDKTDYLVGTWSTLKEDTVYSATNNHPTSTPILHTGNHTADGGSIDVTGHDPEKLFLEMDLFIVDKTNPEKIGDYFTSGQIRLSSPGASGFAYFYTRTHYPNVVNGEWNTLRLPMADISNAANLDMSKIATLYMYFDSVNHAEDSGDTFEMKVRNVRIIDTTTEPKKMELPTLFGDGMIFQQNKDFKVWGTAEAGDTVTATLKKGDEVVEALDAVTVGEDGTFELTFKAQKGSYDTYSIELVNKTAAGGVRTEKTITDVVFGEVWVAGGQSNMQLSVGDDINKSEILAGATNHNVRIYREPTYPVADGDDQPLDPLFSVPGAVWGAGDNANDVQNTSSVGYNFAVRMQEKLDVPVGLLNTAVGGSVIEAWVSRETVADDAKYRTFLDDMDKFCDAFWWPTAANRQSALYNAKIGPLEGYNAAGIIWYQGESNRNELSMYDHALELVQKDWGRVFGFAEDEEMPLIYAQLAAHYYGDKTNYSTPSTVLAYMAETMSKAWEAHPDSMSQIAIYDLPLHHLKENGTSAGAIHPTNKIPVANRMVTAAMNLVYGGEGTTSSPVFKSMVAQGNAIYVTFDLVGDGLKIGNDSQNLQGFAIAGEDGYFVNAQAEIVSKDTVKVWNNKVANPQNVTYAFTTFNMAGNLWNSDDLAAVPFRTTTETDDAKLFRDHDWIYADGEVWVSVNASNEVEKAAFHDLWTATDATHSYDKEVKSEGKASLKVAYTGNSTTISPELNAYQSLQEKQFQNFTCLTVDMKNADNREKSLKLALVTAGGTYVVKDPVVLAANSDFVACDFNLTDLTDASGAAVADAATVLASVTGLQFIVTDTEAGTVHLDNIRFARSMEDVEIGSDALKGDVNANGEVTAEDALMALQAATNKITLTATQEQAADVDGEAGVSASDALMILQYATKKIASF